MISITSVEAQNRFGQLLDTVQREPVSITRHGQPAAFIVSPQDMDDLLDVRRKRTRAVAELTEWSERARQCHRQLKNPDFSALENSPGRGGLR
jgi:prevent-host-death family protein